MIVILIINFSVSFIVIRAYGFSPDMANSGYDIFKETYNLFLGNYSDSLQGYGEDFNN